ncbi:hypothetical protein LK09_15340 [Microbacterium mangrovi]|uniref:HTH cro/C1-type domain-containing protein n=1 Tax=Microbacterium mangrovi TaxID=1348253 RepID=A0A0B1ZYS9_9MICO|nr:helix-turn-helix transcriptional regulator [Microbacterium mangrovi]KHK96360.1 hypothetical protein LK09_15340 [Microbacterium mangrovi]
MVDKTQWSKYIDATSDGAYNNAIAESIGVDPATVGRWRTGTVDPKPRQVVAYARAFGQTPVSALIAAGYLTEAEAQLPAAAPRAYTLDDFSELELATELVRRLRESGDVGGRREDDHSVDLSREAHDLAASEDDSAVDPDRRA